MKMVKSLLLGSAAGVVAVVGAQAADLPVKAKPVQYVKICTLYGDGFYYIPGSDTCIRFAGYIRADYNWNGRTPHVQGASGAQDRTVSRYTTRHRANFTSDARTQTAYGTLRAYMSLNAEVAEGASTLGTHRAFIQWGGFTIGRTASFVDHEGSLGDGGMRSLYTGLVDSTTGAAGINQIAYTWQLGNGITLNVGADEPRNSSVFNATQPATIGGSGATSTGYILGADPLTSRHGTSHPDPWVSLRMTQAWGRASIAAIGHKNAATYYSANAFPGFVPPAGCVNAAAPNFTTGITTCGHPDDKWGWAVLAGAEIKLDMLSPGSRVGFYGTVGSGAAKMSANSQISPSLFGSGNTVSFGANTDAVYVNGGQLQLTDHYSFGGGFEYFWTRNFSSTIYGGYTRFEYNSTVVNGNFFCLNNGTAPGGQAQGFNVAAGQRCDPSYALWQVGTHHDWFPLPGLRFAVDVLYTRVESDMAGQTVTLARGPASFTNQLGARTNGVYTVKDLGLISVMARAQRSWGAD
jgi:hypothetical protein